MRSKLLRIELHCHNFATCPIQLTMKFWECLPVWVADCVKGKDVREIRLRNNAVARVNVGGRWYCCSREGLITNAPSCAKLDVPCDDIVRLACNNSIYAYEQMLARGYFTLADGSRFGVAGSYSSVGQVFKRYTSICIRIPHCVSCADERVMGVVESGNTVIFGPPSSGKTTLLRDVAKRLSTKHNVSVLDERGELDVGDALHDCDVLKWTSKTEGFEMALRSLSPEYVLCDELSASDLSWINRAASCGVKVIATLHAGNIDEVKIAVNGFGYAIFCKNIGWYECISFE